MSAAEFAALDAAEGLVTQCRPSPQPVAALVAERAGMAGLVAALRVMWHGSREAVRVVEVSAREAEAEPELSKADLPMLSRPACFRRAVAVTRRVAAIRRKLGWPVDGWRAAVLSEVAVGDAPSVVHDSVFVAAIQHLASPEQRATWLPAAQEYAVLGCYAQTELGHGSDVSRLETTATFIPSTSQVELHTPRLESTKWWVGGLGRTATHAIVWARLRVPAPARDSSSPASPSASAAPAAVPGLVDVGPMPFLVRIRDAATHEPLPGVTVGDIGPKLGFAAIDNGYLRLSRFRVPRTSLLGECGALSAGGVFSPPAHPKRAYAGMMAVRVFMLRAAASGLALGSTVALRYSALRLQFALPPADADGSLVEALSAAGGRAAGPASPTATGARAAAASPARSAAGEVCVLDHGLQRQRTLPWACLAWTLRAASASLGSWHGDVMRSMEGHAGAEGKQHGAGGAQLGSLHSLSACLKATGTALAADGVEGCRLACGGHGYSELAGLSPVWRSLVHTCTAEGENGVMLLQAARAILRARSGQLPAEAAAPAAPKATVLPGADAVAVVRDHLGYLAGEALPMSWSALLPAELVAEISDDAGAGPRMVAGAAGAEGLQGPLSAELCLALLMAASRAAADEAGTCVQEAAAARAGGAFGSTSSLLGVASAQAQPQLAAAAKAHAHAVLAAASIRALHAAEAAGAAAAAATHAEAAGASGEAAPVPLSAEACAQAVVHCSVAPKVLRSVTTLALLALLERSMGHLLACGAAGPGTPAALAAATAAVCARLRPVAVALADGFGVPDYTLASAIGREDGAAYGGMWLWAQRSSLGNKAAGTVDAAFASTLRPMMQEGLAAVRAQLGAHTADRVSRL